MQGFPLGGGPGVKVLGSFSLEPSSHTRAPFYGKLTTPLTPRSFGKDVYQHPEECLGTFSRMGQLFGHASHAHGVLVGVWPCAPTMVRSYAGHTEQSPTRSPKDKRHATAKTTLGSWPLPCSPRLSGDTWIARGLSFALPTGRHTAPILRTHVLTCGGRFGQLFKTKIYILRKSKHMQLG